MYGDHQAFRTFKGSGIGQVRRGWLHHVLWLSIHCDFGCGLLRLGRHWLQCLQARCLEDLGELLVQDRGGNGFLYLVSRLLLFPLSFLL
jgi:hypothetical protein